jgi:hypothetical protein
VLVMSECQHNGFATVDRPSTPTSLPNCARLSTWAHIPRTSLVNEYHWCILRGDPKHLVERYDLTAEYRRKPALLEWLSAAGL